METDSPRPLLEVAVLDAGVDTLGAFDYLAPETGPVPPPGAMVAVPFGNSVRIGIVLGHLSESRAAQLKSVLQRVEEFEPLPRELIDLARWVAWYYMSSPGSVFAAMIPIGARFGVRRWVRAEPDADASGLTGRALDALRALSRFPDGVQLTALKKTLGFDPSAAVRTLEKKGLVAAEYRLKQPRVSVKTRKALSLAVDAAGALAQAREREGRAPAQARLLRFLAGASGPVALTRIKSEAGAGPAVARSLVDEGLIAVSDQEVRRKPLSAPMAAYSEPKTLAPDQRAVFDELALSISRARSQVFCIEGVTGSGKTEIYLQAVARCLEAGRGAIVLVPEIALTTVMSDIFTARFGDKVAILHSGLSDGERYDEYRRIRSGLVPIVLGARSAVFSPMQNIGLVVMDEEQETSFKQESSPRYHALTVAIRRAKAHNAAVVVGSATPTVETYHRGRKEVYRLFRLPTRIDDRPMPRVDVVDMREVKGEQTLISPILEEGIRIRLQAGEQVLLFHNRRGYNSFTICRSCGFVIECPNCSISMKYHQSSRAQQCHFCDYRTPAAEQCPRCNSRHIGRMGWGTEQVEERVRALFPEAAVARMDRDTTTAKGAHRRILTRFREGAADILIGTQMVAKGFDFPGITLVGVLSADTGLHMPDFRAAERTFSLLTQVAGRAGRGDKPGRVVVQSFTPEHYAVRFAVEQNYPEFWAHEIGVRERTGYPPFSRLIRVMAAHQELARVQESIMKLGRELRAELKPGIESPHQVLGPSEAAIPRLNNRYRWGIGIKTRSQRHALMGLVAALDRLPGSLAQCIFVDVDPLSML